MKNKKILVLASHPDDEVLGCGGTINKLSKQNCKIKTVFLSDGETSRLIKNKNKKILQRKLSAKKASKILGYNDIKFHNFPDNQLYKIEFLKIIKIIEKNLLNFKPNIVFTHYEHDLNIDHSIVSKATTTACRPAKFKFIEKLLYYKINSSTEWNFGTSQKFNPNYFVDISKNINSKLNAMMCYKNEITNKHPRSLEAIKSFCLYNGSIIGVDYAEPFLIGYSKN